ncbi:MAG: Flp pilus assembly complex ATPase component TadA [Deltaproteobacteria bacterium]|nr:Flp pilus assembly complex ATPase component TadA [Deltaproteobacteria bacterium]MCB9786072.1 Flp pilus assembly complex ATPase component TadA [Deltaproteobacteria bacterium]
MLTVTIREKDGDERRLMFQEEEVTIGRAKGSDIMLPRNNISKRHARLVDKDEKVVLVDLRSTNGTYVNGRRITAPEIITPADKIYIGDFIIRVEAAAAAAPALGEMESTQALDIAMLGAAASGGATEAVGAEAAMQQAIEEAEREARAEAQALEAKTRAAEQQQQRAAAEPEAWDDVLESTQALDLSAVEAIDARGPTIDSPAGRADMDFGYAAEAAPEPAPQPRPAEPAAQSVAQARPAEPAEPVAQRRAPEPVAQQRAPEPVAQVQAAPLPSGGLGNDGFSTLLADASVEHILVNSHDSVVVSQGGPSRVLATGFESPAALERAVQALLESTESGLVERDGVLRGTLPQGESLHVVPRALAPSGPIVTIRRRRTRALSLADLVQQDAMTQGVADYLAEAVASRKNIVVLGAAASGRTTVVNALAATFAPDERILVLADAQELSLPHRNVMHLDKGALHDTGQVWTSVVSELLAQRVVIDPVAPDDLVSAASLALGGHDGMLLTATGSDCHGFLRRAALQLGLYASSLTAERSRAMVAELVDVAVLVERHGGAVQVAEIVSVEGSGPEELHILEILGRG